MSSPSEDTSFMNDQSPTSTESAVNPTHSRAGESTPTEKKGKTPLIILAVIIVILLIAAAAYSIATRDQESTDDAQVDGNAVSMQAKVSGFVTELDVGDNQQVKAGQLLFRIDRRDAIAARDQAQASVAQARSQEKNARANLDMTQVNAPAKLAQAKSQSASAIANLNYAIAELQRQTSVEARSTSRQAIDQARQNVLTATANLENQQAQVRIAGLIPQTLAQAQAQLDQAVAQVAQATAQLTTAELNLGYTEVRAPQDGTIAQRNVQVGSYVTAGQSVFSLVTPQIWITANFKENQLAHMRVGQHVTIRIDAYPDLRVEGHVDSLQVGTGSRFSAFPAENATGNFIKIVQRVPVKIAIDRGLDPNIRLGLGLSAQPTVELQ